MSSAKAKNKNRVSSIMNPDRLNISLIAVVAGSGFSAHLQAQSSPSLLNFPNTR
ncbi:MULTISPECIES: hypothetical protein [Pseudomonas]|uniref:Uncharacterized protein n=1 Tax=Pseudomonas phytophila TaxID=2867264 RepID=A0ABY6F7G3_9PSED|nr:MULTISPECIES: hypothetical protein [Pseudomonas]MCQ2995389.1 hypothetical protein [Pseudomonas syringae]MCD5978188.1 hypothetical protein [Pseudomonas quasicaspiana]MCD5987965.1 hypothetical protein [Pseudomonas quasicaspiana]MCQ3031145.1 hypothetical protein [Pseudomonas syringae]MDG6398547.1 hypothetical protein [Pseudomonas quasicaspiana]